MEARNETQAEMYEGIGRGTAKVEKGKRGEEGKRTDHNP